MDTPDIESTFKDANDVLWRFKAFRKLSEDEMSSMVEGYMLISHPRKHPKPGTEKILVTTIGRAPHL